jgi:hypothetical protein
LILLPNDYNINSNNNGNNNQNFNRNVNHVDVIRDNSIMEIDSHTPIDRVHNVTGIRTRGMLAKQIPSSSQPIVPPPTPLSTKSSESERTPVIPPVVNLPIETIQPNKNLDNLSKATSQSQPIIPPMVDNSLTLGMPKVLPTTNPTLMGSKNFNPIITGDTFGYNPIGQIHNIPSNTNPISLPNPPLGVVLPGPPQSIKVPQNLSQPGKQPMDPSIGSNIIPLKGRKARRFRNYAGYYPI